MELTCTVLIDVNTCVLVPFSFALLITDTPHLHSVNSWRTHTRFPTFQVPGPRNNKSIHGDQPNYYKEGRYALGRLGYDFRLEFTLLLHDIDRLLDRG